MKLAVFSDIHGNYQALSAIIKDIKQRGITQIYSLGDTIAIGPNSHKCLDKIMRENIRMTKGNHEMYYILGTEHYKSMSVNEAKHHKWIRMQIDQHSKRFIESCPIEYSIDTKISQIKLMHFGHDGTDFFKSSDNKAIEEMYQNTGYLVVYGHVHKGSSLREVNNTYYFGLESSGCRKDDITTYTIITLNKTGYEVGKIYVKYDRKSFVDKMNRIDYPEKDFVSHTFFGLDS